MTNFILWFCRENSSAERTLLTHWLSNWFPDYLTHWLTHLHRLTHRLLIDWLITVNWISLNERKFGVVKSICCYCRGEYSSPKINKSYVVKVESRDYCKIRWLCNSEKFLSELNEAKTAHWPCSPRSSLSASKSSSAKWVKRLSGLFRTVKNLSKAFGPLFSNKLSNVCDAWMEPNLFSVAFISSLSEGQKTEPSCAAISVGLVMLFMITVVLLANTFLWIASMFSLPAERGSQLPKYTEVTTSRATSGGRRKDRNTSGQRGNKFNTSYRDISVIVAENNSVVKPNYQQYPSLNKMLSNFSKVFDGTYISYCCNKQ